MKKIATKISYEEALEQLKDFQDMILEKKLKLSKRVDMAKTWAALGMKPEEIAVIIGVGPSSLANVFGTMKFNKFQSNKDKMFKETLEQIKEYNKSLLNEVNFYLSDKNKGQVIKANSNGLISKDSIKLLRNEIEEAKKDNKDDVAQKMEEVVNQAAIIAVANLIEEENRLMNEFNNNDDVDLENLAAPTSEELKYTTETLQEIGSTENGREVLQKAIDSKAIRKKYENNPVYIYSSSLAGLKLKPSIAKKYVNEDDEDEKKKRVRKQYLSL